MFAPPSKEIISVKIQVSNDDKEYFASKITYRYQKPTIGNTITPIDGIPLMAIKSKSRVLRIFVSSTFNDMQGLINI